MPNLLALGASIGWGVGDFLLGSQARRSPVLAVATVAQLTGTVIIVMVVLARGVPAPPIDQAWIGIGSGVLGGLVFLGIVAALAMGNMARVAPIFGVQAVIPVVVGLAGGEQPSATQLVGIVIAILGVILVSTESAAETDDDRVDDTRRGLLLAGVSAVGAGVVLSGIDHVADYDPYWATLLFRCTTFAVLAAVCVFALVSGRGRLRGLNLSLVPLLAFGLLDTFANGAWAVASSEGLLSVVSVLGGLFPAVTTLLAVIVLKERLDRIQTVGVVITVVATVLLAGSG